MCVASKETERFLVIISLALLIFHSTISTVACEKIDGDESSEYGQESERASPLVMAANGGDKPRLIPLVASDSGYSENSSVNILCTVSQGHHETLTFDWFKDGQSLKASEQLYSLAAPSISMSEPLIENQADHSLLRISRVKSQQAGRYTCSAKNQFGQDSSSVNLAVNVKLQWTKEPPKEIVVSLNQELKVDCLAQGEPRPQMRWEKLDSPLMSHQQHISPTTTTTTRLRPSFSAAAADSTSSKNQLAASSFKQQSVLVSSNRYLLIQRAKETDSGVYECIASNSHDADLRKLVSVQVRGVWVSIILALLGGQQAIGQQNGELHLRELNSNDGESQRISKQTDVAGDNLMNQQQHQQSAAKIQYVNVNGLPVLVQFTYVGPPKILPIATADSYPEGSLINLICTVSGGQRNGLSLSWAINGEELQSEKMKYSQSMENVSIGSEDADISILKIKNASHVNSGQYTCTAKNALGQDSTSVNIVINVELKWTKIPRDTEVGLNQELSLECDALGSPQPTIEWFKHSSSSDKTGSTPLVKGRLFKISRAQHKDSGLYECSAKNGLDNGLRKIVQVKVRERHKLNTKTSGHELYRLNLTASAAGFLFVDRSDAHLNLSNSVDSNLSRILDRDGPDMRPSRDFKDFGDITLDVSKRAWTLLHGHAKLAIQKRLDLVTPAFYELLDAAQVSDQCKRAIYRVVDGAIDMDSWAVKLLNSWGNFPTVGLFEGTYGDVGSFHTCVNIKRNYHIDHAHYCSLTFRPVMPSRKNYELVVRKEPNDLLELFEQMKKDRLSKRNYNDDDELMQERRQNQSGPEEPIRDAFSDILVHAQYHHYVYYKIGTCWPIKCSPFDVRRVAKLAARRMVLMNGPVKCYSRYEDDYEEPGSVKPPGITTYNNKTQIVEQKKLVISIWDKNDGIFIWKPHFYTAHKIALGVIAVAVVFMLSMTAIDIFFNRIPQLVAFYEHAAGHKYTMANLKPQMEIGTGEQQRQLEALSTTESRPETTTTECRRHQQRPTERGELSIWMTIVDDCSIITNTIQFFTITEAQSRQISCLDGVRCISMVWIILTHTMMYNDWSSFARTREVENAVKSLVSQPFFNGSYLVDTFFLLSGLLSAYTAFRHCKGSADKFSSFGFILNRWLRLTPQIFFCSLIYIVLPAVSYGPHWFPIVGEYSENCVENWWINVLHLQAFYKSEKMCNFVTWWISIDYLYHFFALALIWVIIYAGHKLGFASLAVLVGGQVCWQAIRHYQMSLPPNVMSTIPQTGAMWTEMTINFFWKPYAHSVPFFFGFYIGYLMALKKKLIIKQLNARRALIGWLLSTVLFVGQSYSTYWWISGKFDYPRLVSTIFQVVCPIIWAGSLCWTILACQHGYGGIINDFLSARVFIILGKASYMIYLSHFQVLFIYFGNQSLLLEPSELVMFYIIVGNVFLSTLYGIFLCVIFEFPWLKLQRKLMKYV